MAKVIYVVCNYADDWYEERKCIAKLGSYKECKDYLVKHDLTELLNKLNYVESIKKQLLKYGNDLVISYC